MYRPGTYINNLNFGKGFILESLKSKDSYRLYIHFNNHGKKYIKINKNKFLAKGI